MIETETRKAAGGVTMPPPHSHAFAAAQAAGAIDSHGHDLRTYHSGSHWPAAAAAAGAGGVVSPVSPAGEGAPQQLVLPPLASGRGSAPIAATVTGGSSPVAHPPQPSPGRGVAAGAGGFGGGGGGGTPAAAAAADAMPGAAPGAPVRAPSYSGGLVAPSARGIQPGTGTGNSTPAAGGAGGAGGGGEDPQGGQQPRRNGGLRTASQAITPPNGLHPAGTTSSHLATTSSSTPLAGLRSASLALSNAIQPALGGKKASMRKEAVGGNVLLSKERWMELDYDDSGEISFAE